MLHSSFFSPSRRMVYVIFGVLGAATLCSAYPLVAKHAGRIAQRKPSFTKEQLATMLGDSAAFYQFPKEIPVPGETATGALKYSFDSGLQDEMVGLMKSYRPDYGAFVAVDAETGRVLSMVSFVSTDAQYSKVNLALRATYPSASVFKVVTAAAAIENQKFSADTLIHFNGANHTLYRGNILNDHYNRWSRYATLKDAFAKSINTVFGRIGAYNVGPVELSKYASRFGFNHPILADFRVEAGRAPIPEDAWGLAEAASGYTRDNTMSPLQAAMMAAAVVDDGKMMEPYFVQSVSTPGSGEIYSAQPKMATVTVDPKTAAEIRRLMRETIAHGTASRSFRGFSRSKFRDLDVGGKTGSLTGEVPKGKYDWFVGFAEGRGHRLAFAALTIHQKLWRVKSSYLARRAIEKYFSAAK
ncbi:MAG: penicillin-binding transpeptidase domain-containing protein [Oligoflexia bacterium]|nr:penicillin-binding transpeptidase domain-containing protein [Oligoflexia bacterium]